MVFLFAGTSHKGTGESSPSKKSTTSNSKTSGSVAGSTDDEDCEEAKSLPKEAAAPKKHVDVTDPETKENTRLNALLYHTSDETVDMYKREHNSSDLLGRLYYDDYDSDSVASHSVTPLLSPNITGGHNSGTISPAVNLPSSEYFQSKMGKISSASTHSINSTSSLLKPPLPRGRSFERGVSFDTSTDDHRRSLTFKLKHPEFKFRRNNKTMLTGYNGDPESLKAIEWLFDEMIVNGDTVIILQVLDEKHFDRIDKREANKALGKIELLNSHAKKIRIVFETVIGKPQKLLKKAIAEYNPQMMVIGTHHYEQGQSSSKSFLSRSSFSKHFLECALVPVIVVKPTYKHVEYLAKPVDSETYFADMLSKLDYKSSSISDSHSHRKISRKLLSPSSSRTSSYTNIAAMAGSKHHNLDVERLKENQHFAGVDSERGRSLGGDSAPNQRGSRSSSRSRSRSTSKSRLSMFFHH